MSVKVAPAVPAAKCPLLEPSPEDIELAELATRMANDPEAARLGVTPDMFFSVLKACKTEMSSFHRCTSDSYDTLSREDPLEAIPPTDQVARLERSQRIMDKVAEMCEDQMESWTDCNIRAVGGGQESLWERFSGTIKKIFD